MHREKTARRRSRFIKLELGLTVFVGLIGCASQPRFPAPISTYQEDDCTVFVFDVDGNKQPDFWQYQSPDGRKTAIAYAETTGLPIQRIELEKISPNDCPHFVLALDGVPFEIVDDMYREGHFRFFHWPSRVICCFPSMTDLALTQLFHAGKCVAYESDYFDRSANRMSDGNAVYLSGRNAPWSRRMAYRCSFWWDALAYLKPQTVFDHEMNGIWNAFHKVEEGRACAYSVASAGLGTRGGRQAIRRYLETIDRLCEQILYERKGRANITLLADHGHNLVENWNVSFRDTLERAGYRVTEELNRPGDVVEVGYGLVTYASFCTNDPVGVATCLLDHPDVEFACYRDGEDAVVCSIEGQARIRKTETGYRYEFEGADPLGLTPILETVRETGKITPDGEIDEEALFAATIEHEYPDPLARIWTGLFELVEQPPDVVVNLRDGACHGSSFFEKMIGHTASTHGSLNRMNSTTFVMTTLGELPPALRSREVLPVLRRYFRPSRNLLDENIGQ